MKLCITGGRGSNQATSPFLYCENRLNFTLDSASDAYNIHDSQKYLNS